VEATGSVSEFDEERGKVKFEGGEVREMGSKRDLEL